MVIIWYHIDIFYFKSIFMIRKHCSLSMVAVFFVTSVVISRGTRLTKKFDEL